MSLILDALQRADKERAAGHEVPGIDTDHIVLPLLEGDSKIGAQIQRKIFIVLLMLVVALLTVVIYLQTVDHPALDTITVQDVELAPTSNTGLDKLSYLNSEQEPKSNVKIKPVSNSNSIIRNKVNVNSLYNKANKEKQAAEQVSFLEPALKTETISAHDEQLIENKDVYGSILFAKQLTDKQQSSIPRLRYTTHGYNVETKTGVVRLNGRKFRRGETVSRGLVLLEVAEDYIVLDMNGLLFRLPAATDWEG